MWKRIWQKLKDNSGSMRFAGRSVREVYREFNGTGGAAPGLPLNSIQFHNPLNLLDGDADLTFVASTGMYVGKDIPVYLNGNGGDEDAYIKFNTSADYLELYVDGALRAQF